MVIMWIELSVVNHSIGKFIIMELILRLNTFRK